MKFVNITRLKFSQTQGQREVDTQYMELGLEDSRKCQCIKNRNMF